MIGYFRSFPYEVPFSEDIDDSKLALLGEVYRRYRGRNAP